MDVGYIDAMATALVCAIVLLLARTATLAKRNRTWEAHYDILWQNNLDLQETLAEYRQENNRF